MATSSVGQSLDTLTSCSIENIFPFPTKLVYPYCSACTIQESAAKSRLLLYIAVPDLLGVAFLHLVCFCHWGTEALERTPAWQERLVYLIPHPPSPTGLHSAAHLSAAGPTSVHRGVGGIYHHMSRHAKKRLLHFPLSSTQWELPLETSQWKITRDTPKKTGTYRSSKSRTGLTPRRSSRPGWRGSRSQHFPSPRTSCSRATNLESCVKGGGGRTRLCVRVPFVFCLGLVGPLV